MMKSTIDKFLVAAFAGLKNWSLVIVSSSAAELGSVVRMVRGKADSASDWVPNKGALPKTQRLAR